MPKRKVKDESDDDWNGTAISVAASSSKGKGRGRVTVSNTVVKREGNADDDVKPTVPSQVQKGKKRARKDEHPAAEVRQARFRAKMPKNIQERLERVQSQRFFLVGRERIQGDLKEEFNVLGSVGNVYTIIIEHVPSCNCPDALKGNHCKHILFVFLRVLHQPAHSSYIYQKALLTSELEDIFANAPPNPSAAVLNSDVIKAWEQATGSPSKGIKLEPGVVVEDETGKRRLPKEGDDCPVCNEDIEHEDLAKLVFCTESCGGALHEECMSQWATTKRAQGVAPTCTYCRAKWPEPALGALKGNPNAAPSIQEGYINLAEAVGISGRRDTSSYYHGPRAGMSQSRANLYAEARYGGYPYYSPNGPADGW